MTFSNEHTHTHTHLPHDEVKFGPGQHENTQQRGDRAVNHRRKHVLQRHRRALVSVANRCQEALRKREGGRWGREVSWKSCRSHKTCACGEALASSLVPAFGFVEDYNTMLQDSRVCMEAGCQHE